MAEKRKLDHVKIIPQYFLFLDDDIKILKKLKRSLKKKKNFKVLTAQSVDEAKSLLKSNTIDVVVSDLTMPEIDNLKFLKFVKKKYPQIICLLLTEKATFEEVQKVINEIGIFSLLLKPWEDKNLISTLLRAGKEAEKTKMLNNPKFKPEDTKIEPKVTKIELSRLFIIFAEWNEEFGPLVVANDFPDNTEELIAPEEVIVTQTFMTFSSIYGEDWIGKSKIINLPIEYINMNARIYFEIKEDIEVRGGRKPYMLIILMPNIPKSIEGILDGICLNFLKDIISSNENKIKNSKIMLKQVKNKIVKEINQISGILFA